MAAWKVVLVMFMFILSLSPWFLRNYNHYGRLKLTAQAGEHLLQYIVPFVWQYSEGIPFIEGMKKASGAFQERAEREGWDLKNADPFEKSDLQVRTAVDYLKKAPATAIAKAWGFGMVKNLFAPAIIDFSYLLNIERPHFFYTEGKTLLDRGWNFIRGIKGVFGWVVIVSIFGLVASRLLQLWGLILLFREKKWGALFCILIIGYFLLVSGPVGYAKYRLPFEPILIILLAISLRDIYERVKRKEN